ncbi:MAG: tRNA pseudouridine(38-40) synthase TruA [Bacteroidales bacterium]|nr:tRNA pseudouridine(38-40) synthase TruA [Bacteroidales bacterium]
MRYFMHLAYNGTPYHGWQIQPNAPTVQQTLEEALSIFCNEKINIVGCGRTDTGVHATNFYAHFDTQQQFDENQLTHILYKVNAFAGENIAVYRIFPVADDFHARFSATARTYQYHVATQKLPFRQEFVYRIFFDLDVEKMNAAAEILYQYEDFTSFSKLHTQTATNNCNVMYAHWDEIDNELIFTIKANRFLRNMVRAITGTLIDVGRGKITLDDFRNIIESRNRCNAGTSLPAKALFLTEVEYGDTKL